MKIQFVIITRQCHLKYQITGCIFIAIESFAFENSFIFNCSSFFLFDADASVVNKREEREKKRYVVFNETNIQMKDI